MADDVTLPGTGAVVGADEISSVKYQRVKLIHGADGTNAGDVSTTNGLPTDARYVGGTAVNARAPGFARVSDEPSTLFYDAFDTALDTTNRWTATTSGGGAAAAVSAGRLTLGSGTTTNGYAYVTSLPTFSPTVPGWLGCSFALKLEFAVGNNAVRFWGLGIVGGTPSSTTPLGATGNGIGFEVDTSGVLKAVFYSNGTRTVIDALASFQPANANDHRYIVEYRTDATYFYIDGLAGSQLVATASFQSPQAQVMSVLLLSVAHSSAPASSRVIDCAGLATWDTAKGNVTISDGVLPFRKATVAKASTAAAATDLPLVVALHPTSTGAVGGNIAHDGIDSGNPVLSGARAIAHGSNPAAVAAADRTVLYANRAGIPFVIGGHPNIVSYGMSITTAVSNTIVGPTIASGTKFVCTGLSFLLDNASTVFSSVVIGFGTANTPAFATTPGTAKVLAGHPACPAGGGLNLGDGSGILGIGADDEEVRITTVGNAGGNGLYVLLKGYTIES